VGCTVLRYQHYGQSIKSGSPRPSLDPIESSNKIKRGRQIDSNGCLSQASRQHSVPHAPHAPPPTHAHRHPTTPSRLLQSTTSSPSPPPLCSPSPPPRRAAHRSLVSSSFPGFLQFPDVHRFALVLSVASCPTSSHTSRKSPSESLVCNESLAHRAQQISCR
jgi:hypothetical protein